MKVRLITALIAFIVLLPYLFFSDTFMLEVFVSALATVASYEMLKVAGLLNRKRLSVPSLLLAFLLPYTVRRIGSVLPLFSFLGAVLFVYMFYLMAVATFSRNAVTIQEAALTLTLNLYVVFSFLCVILLRDLPNGQYIYLLIFVSAWMTDSGAYFIGRFFGRHKLIPDVSPKKTVEGAVGGVVICILSYLLYGFVIGRLFHATPNYPALAVMGAVTSVISQCGDLIASLVKRSFGVKDYGWIFPGHGGVMDRFDSIIAVAPFLYILYSASGFFELFL